MSNFQIVRVADVWDGIMEKRRRWQEEKRVGRVSVDSNNIVTFHYNETGETYRYWFTLDRCRTPEQQMEWLNHLRFKPWFNREYFNDFMDCLEYLGLLPEGLQN